MKQLKQVQEIVEHSVVSVGLGFTKLCMITISMSILNKVNLFFSKLLDTMIKFTTKRNLYFKSNCKRSTNLLALRGLLHILTHSGSDINKECLFHLGTLTKT